jgi:hypothetical protein
VRLALSPAKLPRRPAEKQAAFSFYSPDYSIDFDMIDTSRHAAIVGDDPLADIAHDLILDADSS